MYKLSSIDHTVQLLAMAMVGLINTPKILLADMTLVKKLCSTSTNHLRRLIILKLEKKKLVASCYND